MSAVAKRYAEALFQLSRERGQLDNVQQDIELVAKSVVENEQFARFLAHPQLDAGQKKEALLNVFAAYISEISQSFLKLLIDRGRQELLPLIVKEYVALANEWRGVTAGEAVTVVSLTNHELTRLENIFSKAVGKRVQLNNVVDPDIKGGVVVRIADRVYDGSVAGKLARFQKQLQETQV